MTETRLTDPRNDYFIITPPVDVDVTAVVASARPKMRTYAALVAAVNLKKKKFEEQQVKRDSSGKFAKKAGSKVAAPTPAKKSVAPPTPVPGKKMTNKVIYGKHANGTIIETGDGQHRMVFNEAGNNWTFQERTPDGGWKVLEVLGKAASYKKAHELSDSWTAPHDGTPDELTPVPGPDEITTPNAFQPGWDVISDPSLTNFKKMQILATFESLINNPNVMPVTVAYAASNIASTYGVDPETVLALIDQDEGNTKYSDMVKKHLNGDSFPPPTHMVPGVKKTAAKKLASKNTAAKKSAVAPPSAVPSTPAAATVAPSPPISGVPSVGASTTPTYTAGTNPYALHVSGQPVDLGALEQQLNESTEISNLRQHLQDLSQSNASTAEITAASGKYVAARKKYSKTYGIGWGVNQHAGLVQAYKDAASGGVTSTLPDGTVVPGAASGVVVGATVQIPTGNVGTVVGPGTDLDGNPGVEVALLNGSNIVSPMVGTTPLNETQTALVQNAPASGATVYHATNGKGTVTGLPKANPAGVVHVPVTYDNGTYTYAALDTVSTTPPTPAAPIASAPPVGAAVSTPNGPGHVTDVDSEHDLLEVTFPNGITGTFATDEVDEIDPSLAPSSTAPTTPVGTPAIPMGTIVSTPHGNGTLVGMSSGGAYSYVQMASGNQIEVLSDDVVEISATSPPTVVPTPPPNPGVSYDGNGVPMLSSSDQAIVAAQFQNAGVNWYNPSEKLFDAAHAASQATGLSIEDVLKFADANFHNSAKDGGKPIQTKVAKWAKSSKGKAHIQATLGSPTAPPPVAPTVVTPATPTPAPTPSSASSGGAALPGTPINTSVPKIKKVQAYSQFTAGFTTLTSDPGILAQKAADVAKNTGLTPEQVLAIVDEKKAQDAGVPNGNLFSNKVLGHLNGKKWPTPTPPLAPSAGATHVSGGAPALPVTPGFDTLDVSSATQLQSSMVAASTPLTAGQTASLKYYTSNNYKKINTCLRFNTGCTHTVKMHIEQGTAGMRPTTQNITTFRGTGLKAFGVGSVAELEQMVGKTVAEPGFSSTSISPASAFGGQVSMQIEIPAGTPGSYIGNISHFPEKEFLLPPGTKFRILEVKPASGGSKAFVRVEVVPA